MEATVEHLHTAFSQLRTGGANPATIERLRVACYGSETELITVASISAPDKRNLIVRPYDPSVLQDIEKAILKSKVGLTPLREGKILRLPVPPLTEERRIELTKEAKSLAEDHKIAIRNIRRDCLKFLQATSEDQQAQFETQIDALTKGFITKVDEALKIKCDALMNVDGRWNEPKRRK